MSNLSVSVDYMWPFCWNLLSLVSNLIDAMHAFMPKSTACVEMIKLLINGKQ